MGGAESPCRSGTLLEMVGQTCTYVQKDIAVDSPVVQGTSLGDLEKSQQASSSWPPCPSTVNVKVVSSFTQGHREDG